MTDPNPAPAPAASPVAHLNPSRKTVTFTLAGRDYPVRASLGLMCEVETRFGPATALFDRMQARQFRITELRALLKVLLPEDAPSGEALDEALEAAGLVEVMNRAQILLAFGLASDQPEDGKKPPAGN
ncbi:gene transfer agent family protein [Roseomonas frigidaquae]|uniref:Gene transfer agent family protein n=1 Tax=Falsiroseomonas frigidaquae TaxID=487318 RepID=A0ABX1ES33_9PROT|nr:GTA-gp10 family protein [Falsiroseomonas frigidaquae]NKE43382.1 gene transfer agent family protein [Falsiroseomonas frigidaquae]